MVQWWDNWHMYLLTLLLIQHLQATTTTFKQELAFHANDKSIITAATLLEKWFSLAPGKIKKKFPWEIVTTTLGGKEKNFHRSWGKDATEILIQVW